MTVLLITFNIYLSVRSFSQLTLEKVFNYLKFKNIPLLLDV